jgi:hypothetical protein
VADTTTTTTTGTPTPGSHRLRRRLAQRRLLRREQRAWDEALASSATGAARHELELLHEVLR